MADTDKKIPTPEELSKSFNTQKIIFWVMIALVALIAIIALTLTVLNRMRVSEISRKMSESENLEQIPNASR